MFELQHYGREALETPAEEVFSEAEMRVIESILQGGRLLSPSKRARTPLEDIGAWVVCTACIAGLRPWGLQPLPGSRMLWRAWMTVEACVRFDKALASADRGLRPAGPLLATLCPGSRSLRIVGPRAFLTLLRVDARQECHCRSSCSYWSLAFGLVVDCRKFGLRQWEE